ncbi:MAG: hypothetical protein WBL62_04450 [Gallionella sp.]
MSVLVVCGVAFFAAWLAWLIFYVSPKKTKSLYKFPATVVKHPPLRIPSRKSSIIQDKPIPTGRAKPGSSGLNQDGFNQRQGSVCAAEKRLRGACLGDFTKSSALIDFELKKSMGLYTRSEAAQAALDRLFLDRSR